ncbi:hypothetical protein C0033_13900 [Clostridium sp. chh4-2]|uniref:sensor histidine kinase n=1 Tax=Clostridium sp. chh4-2 TaxID=2067550 RepID=UPI000CCFC634|nr:histidine kinase [Clostridium sp. chh4-2]PNV61385.1 hypothetical protein C0033_13900 [Clostridium sp. chh4-2]
MKKKRELSLKQVILGTFLGILVPLSLFLIVYSTYIAGSIKDTVYESERTTLAVLKSNLENTMGSAERFMSNIVTRNSDFQQLTNELPHNDVYLHSYEVQQEMKNMLVSNPNLFSLVLYSPVNDWYANESNVIYEITSEERIGIQKILEPKVRSYPDAEGKLKEYWFCQKIGKYHYLVRVMNYRDVYCAAFIDLERISSLMNREYHMEGAMALLENNELFYADPVLEPGQIKIPEGDVRYEISGGSSKYMVLREEIQNLGLVYAVPYRGMLSNMNLFQISMFVCAVLVLLAVPAVSFYLRRVVILPLNSLTETMEAIQSGDLSAHVENRYAVRELQQVNRTFNNMMGEIRTLKIEAYEKELERKQAAFQFLQAQIRPHFYLNCLKNLYGMAQSGRFQEIQQTILLLSNHLRYTFSTMEDTISLETEIGQCKNYLDLFSINQQETAILRTNYDVRLTGLPIPPISILTFVENSVKYGLMPGKRLEIKIGAGRVKMEDQELVHITVSDNGPGFPDKVLGKLNRGEEIVDDKCKHHIGIYNVLERFRMIYGEEFMFACSNRNGAIIELFFPLREEEGMKR